MATTKATSPVIEIGERDLKRELETIRQWLAEHPAVTPGGLSVEAGLGRNSLAALLRAKEPETPTAARLDRLYLTLARYGFVRHVSV